MSTIFKCPHCGLTYSITNNYHVARCPLQKDNLVRFIRGLRDYTYRMSTFKFEHYVPKKRHWNNIAREAGVLSFKVTSQILDGMEIDEMIDFMLHLGITNGWLEQSDYPSFMRMEFDCYAYFTKAEYCDRIQKATNLESILRSSKGARLWKSRVSQASQTHLNA